MRLATLKNGILVAVTKNGAVSLSSAGFSGSMKDLIVEEAKGTGFLENISDKINLSAVLTRLEADAFQAPLRNPGKIVAVGLNYKEHAGESKMKVPESPLIFAKFPSSITGPTDRIEIPVTLTQKADYEVELAVIIGKRIKNVTREDALSCVFGYSILNDISARDIQFSESQWVRAKSLDTFCPLGPVIVTADEIPDPQNLELGCELNGSLLQKENTRNMIFGVADIISILSNSFTFEPGDIIATGTPGGVGFSRKPPVYLQNGDILRTWIKGIGEMLNTVSFV